jgi:hypothetical protein
MRKVLMALALATVVVLGATGGASADNQGADWLVAGTGTITPSSCDTCSVFGMIHVNAQNTADGLNPRGHFWIRLQNGGGEFGGTVTCLNVTTPMMAGLIGHIDRVKVLVTNTDFHFIEGNSVFIRVTDAGSPGTLDMVNVDGGTSDAPTSCQNFDTTCCNISQGNYVVHGEPVVGLDALNALNLQIAQFEAQAGDPY